MLDSVILRFPHSNVDWNFETYDTCSERTHAPNNLTEKKYGANISNYSTWYHMKKPISENCQLFTRSAIFTKSDAVWTCLVLIAMGLKSKSILFKQKKSEQPSALIWIGLISPLPADHLPFMQKCMIWIDMEISLASSLTESCEKCNSTQWIHMIKYQKNKGQDKESQFASATWN